VERAATQALQPTERLRASPLDCWSRGGSARFVREGRWADGRVYAAVKSWKGKSPELVHQRPEHTLVLTLAGGTSLTGNRISGTRPYEGADRAGCLSFVPAGAERRGWYRDAEMTFLALVIDPRFADGDLPAFTNRRDRLLEAVLRGLAREMQSGDGPPPSAYVEHAAGLAMAHLERLAACARSPARTRPAALTKAEMAQIVEAVEGGLGRDLSLAELGGVLAMSPRTFARRFTARAGVPPYRFILERRVARARQWLRERDRTIAEIAMALGFCSQSHFTTAFRRHTGTSPAAYRRGDGS
jgi:AraC family transcriptional regulator